MYKPVNNSVVNIGLSVVYSHRSPVLPKIKKYIIKKKNISRFKIELNSHNFIIMFFFFHNNNDSALCSLFCLELPILLDINTM